jgi:Lanthionine synthetase C-like protein
MLIKAYEILKESHYREMAESNLNNIIPRPIITDFTLGNGLAGIGELYLDASRAFNDNAWLERAEWIAQFFIHTFQSTSREEGYWVVGSDDTHTANLFSGNSGILHFLMRYHKPDILHHPLWPVKQE